MTDAKVRVLMVDDEPNLLSGYRRSIGRQFDLVTAIGAQEALEIMVKWPTFPVIVTDMRMPEIDGLEFIARARQLQPKSVYIMLTGNADQQTAIDAINQGQIFRFLSKPCEPASLIEAIQGAKKQFDLVHAEAELLNKTLSGSVKLLVEAMMISDPVAADAIRTVRDRVNLLCQELGLPVDWRYSIAASLFLIGSITVPRRSSDDLFNQAYLDSCAKAGANLLRHIPRLDEVAQIIQGQRTPQSLPEDLTNPSNAGRFAIGSQLLRAAFDWFWAERGKGLRGEGVMDDLAAQGGHDPRLLDAVHALFGDAESGPGLHDDGMTVRQLCAGELVPGMIAIDDVVDQDGQPILRQGQELTQMLIERLIGYVAAGMVEDWFCVRCPESEHVADDLDQAA